MILENLCVLSILVQLIARHAKSSNFVLPVDICTVDSDKPLRPVNSSKPVRPVDICQPIPSANSNAIGYTVDSNKLINSKIVHSVDTRKPLCHVNSSKPVLPVDVRKSLRPVNSNKTVYPVDVYRSGCPADICKPVCLFDIRKPFFAHYWRHVTLFLILLFCAVSVNTNVFNRIILYMSLFINIHMKYLIFTKFFKCTFVILVGYFLYIGDRLFKYLFLGIFIIFQYFSKLLLVILL